MDSLQSNAFKITLTPDQMRALLTLQPMPGQFVDAAGIFKELQEKGISYGVDLDRINLLCKSGMPCNEEVIAAGTNSIMGENAEITYFFDKPSLKPEFTEDGKVDYYRLGGIIQVKAGDILAKRKPSTMGTPGCNVRGEPLKPVPGKHLNFQITKGVVVQEDTAVAEYDGAICWQGTKIGITRIKMVQGDVDFSVGNIDFPGKVLITGWVRNGFRIEAEEDIEIRGGIEDAVVISHQGSIFVHQGIMGRNKAQLKAKWNIEARYVQEANIEAENTIVINEYVIRSNIKAGNSVLLQGLKGKIMGNNNILAGTQIRVNTIQSNKNLSLVVAGIDRNQIFKDIKKTNQLLEIEEENARTLTLQLRMLAGKKDAESLEQLRDLLPRYTASIEQIDTFRERRDELMNLLRSTKGDGMIEVRDKVEYGTAFHIKNEYIQLNNEFRNITIYYDNDEKRIIILNN